MEEVKEVEQPKLDTMRPCPCCPNCGTKMQPLTDMCICPNKECAAKLPRRSWGKCVPCEQRKASLAALAALRAEAEAAKAAQAAQANQI